MSDLLPAEVVHDGHVERGMERDGTRVGEWRRFYPDGALHWVVTHDDQGYMQGEFLEHWPSGELKERGWFLDGESHGAWSRFYNTGTLWMSWCFIYDKQVGPALDFYEHGGVAAARTWVDGVQAGPTRTYFKCGAPAFEAEIRAGEFSGPYRLCDPNGKLMLEGEFVYGARRRAPRLGDGTQRDDETMKRLSDVVVTAAKSDTESLDAALRAACDECRALMKD